MRDQSTTRVGLNIDRLSHLRFGGRRRHVFAGGGAPLVLLLVRALSHNDVIVVRGAVSLLSRLKLKGASGPKEKHHIETTDALS